jgi:hypothetical protein
MTDKTSTRLAWVVLLSLGPVLGAVSAARAAAGDSNAETAVRESEQARRIKSAGNSGSTRFAPRLLRGRRHVELVARDVVPIPVPKPAAIMAHNPGKVRAQKGSQQLAAKTAADEMPNRVTPSVGPAAPAQTETDTDTLLNRSRYGRRDVEQPTRVAAPSNSVAHEEATGEVKPVKPEQGDGRQAAALSSSGEATRGRSALSNGKGQGPAATTPEHAHGAEATVRSGVESNPNVASIAPQASQRPTDAASVGSKPETEPSVTDRGEHVAAMPAPSATMTGSPASPRPVDRRVAIILTDPDIASVSQLTNKNIAIDGSQSASVKNVQSALAAAGANQVQLVDGQIKALDRLIDGEVPAAVLALVSPAAAERFPDIAGFKIFKVPLAID